MAFLRSTVGGSEGGDLGQSSDAMSTRQSISGRRIRPPGIGLEIVKLLVNRFKVTPE